jgi:carbonic anhydrase
MAIKYSSHIVLNFVFVCLVWGSSEDLHPAVEPATKAIPSKVAPVSTHGEAAKRKAIPSAIPAKNASGTGHGAMQEKSLPDLALTRLLSGNKRYITATMAHPNQTIERRNDLAQSQAPFAIIVSCSDSRVPPEILFDQGIGDLFVVRSAGEVMGEVGIGSIEYAVAHLGSSLIMVMGHERCGAVKATVEGGEAPGSIGFICAHIKPAVDRAKKEGGEVLNNAIQYNAENVAKRLTQSPIIGEALSQDKIKIVSAVYDLDDGIVKLNP